jgi:hypothetical protein
MGGNMSPLSIYKEMLQRGFLFEVDGERLKYRGTLEPLTPNLLAKLKENKAEIINFVLEWQKGGPFLQPDGSLVIPFSSDLKYHWWNGGMPLAEIRKEFSRGPLGPWHFLLSRVSLN